jgi:DNA-binding transcriptional ArsR family regulator
MQEQIFGEHDMDAGLREEVNSLHAQLCGALADPNRILILYALADQPHCVGDLASALGLAQPTTSRHLKVLRDRGLVTAQRSGQAVVYTLADTRVTQALDLLRAVLADLLQSQSELGRTVNEQLAS